MFTELPFLARFGAAARCGFDAVELAFPYAFSKEELAGRLREHGLTLVAFNLPAGASAAGERGIACHPGRIAEFRQGVRQAIDYAGPMNCRLVNCLAGPPANGSSDRATRPTLTHDRPLPPQPA